MKVVQCVDAEGNSRAGVIRMEIEALKQLTHPMLAQYREYFQEGDNIHIFMDLGSGNIYNIPNIYNIYRESTKRSNYKKKQSKGYISLRRAPGVIHKDNRMCRIFTQREHIS